MIKELKKYSPLFRPGMLGFIIPGALGLLASIALLIFLDMSIGTIVGAVSLFAIFVIMFIGTFIEMKKTYDKNKKVNYFQVYKGDYDFPVAYSVPDLKRVEGIFNNFDVAELVNELKRVLPKSLLLKMKKTNWYAPIVFVDFVDKVEFSYKGKKITAKGGRQVGKLVEIVWTPENPSRMKSLLRHELGHVFLTFAFPDMNVNTQHGFLREIGC
jgi:hypothetical protein